MVGFEELSERSAGFDPGADFAAFLKEAPAKWVVYLMCDEGGRPVQLLCVKNLRYSLERRLGVGQEGGALSKRVNYRDVVRKVYWRRVDSAFEADAVYLECARAVFPQTYRGMQGFRPAWFVHVDPEAAFPKYAKTIDLMHERGVLLGPVEDKHAAARLIELAEDVFSLCRQEFYGRLVEAPRARACAYKEMGRCPAPCDGSISMETYRRMMAESAAALVEPGRFVEEQTQRMRRAAGELRFEEAARIKARVEQMGQMQKGALRHVKRLEEFEFVSVQRGARAGQAKVFLITPGRIEEVGVIMRDPVPAGDLLRTVLKRADERRGEALDVAGVERIGVVVHHLFAPKAKQRGVFLRLSEIDEKAVGRAYRELLKQKGEEEAVGEGVVKELQA